MNFKNLIVILCVLLASGCMTGKQAVVSAPPVDICPLPSGFRMAPAIETAKLTLSLCPEKLDEVFSGLLEVAKNSPAPENAALIQDMLKELIKQNKVSEIYSRNLYQKHFSRTFVSIPDVKVYRLAGDIDSIRKDLQKELGLKRFGMIECCNDKESYQYAEAEFARVVDFMENLILNEDYVKAEKGR
jgi:hypothetical protein